MALREGDLKDTILKKISFDEFVPKTGSENEVAVMGFYVTQQEAGQDLYNFLGSSIIENRDLEVSPNPNEDGYFMVFVEMDRDENLLDNVNLLVGEVERLAGKLKWEVKTPYIDEAVALANAADIIQMDSSTYLDAADYKAQLDDELAKANLESINEENKKQSIKEFLKNSNLLDVNIAEGFIDLRDARNQLRLEIVNFGHGPSTLEHLGIRESAIKQEFDLALFGKLKSMLGEMKALPIDNYIVIYDNTQENILVTKTC